MNEDDNDPAHAFRAQANRARERLGDDLRDMSTVSKTFLQRTSRTGTYVLVGVGTLLVFALVSGRRRRRPRSSPREPSFLGQAFRTVLLSALGTVASRMARRLPLPLPPSSEPAE
jgi:hypothetical protein